MIGTVRAQNPGPTPVPIREEVVVTATRTETRMGDTAASIVTFQRTDIESSAAPTLDDVLRQAPGFSIFRRSSSRNANPTTQGVSLRGVGSSGASRSIVLFDGVPLNDPFGGWVQWNRVSPIAVEWVEVLRGGASSLYGDAGLSGAVNIIPRRVDDKIIFAADVFAGTQKTLSGSAFAGVRSDNWSADVTIGSFRTAGFIPIEEVARGPVDSLAGVRSTNLAARVSRSLTRNASLFIRPSYFGEVRTNGTGLQTNRTHTRQILTGGDLEAGTLTGVFSQVSVSWRVYAADQVYDQVFSAVNASRTSEGLIRIQRVSPTNFGLSSQLSAVHGDHTIVGGIELKIVRGFSDETVFVNETPSSIVSAGGKQKTVGAFVQDLVRFGRRVVLAGSVRYDQWKNYGAQSSTRPSSGGRSTVDAFADRVEHAISPQASLLYHASDRIALYATVSKSFRSPTLNELYRSFRVGNVLTLLNSDLRAEHALNGEGGVMISARRSSLRATAFSTVVDDPVSNVTLSSSAALITRQRKNAGQNRSRGVEIEGEVRYRHLSVSGGYLLADSMVVSFPSNQRIEGLRIPQVARHQFTAQVRYSYARWTLAAQFRGSSNQYDDDLNLFRLEPYSQVDLFASRSFRERIEIYGAVENLLNSRYSVGRTPIRTVSSPINLRLGIRWK
ncbi:MAG: TonB-dependent receptor [Pyrinomonadaceae bacterium]